MESQVKRIILIDDNARVRQGLSLFFELLDGWDLIAEGSNGQQAIELCGSLQPDIVIMDLLMPVMDGITATRHIREQYPHIKVIALTSATVETDVQEALEAGAVAVLRKYHSRDEIEAILWDVAAMDNP